VCKGKTKCWKLESRRWSDCLLEPMWRQLDRSANVLQMKIAGCLIIEGIEQLCVSYASIMITAEQRDT